MLNPLHRSAFVSISCLALCAAPLADASTAKRKLTAADNAQAADASLQAKVDAYVAARAPKGTTVAVTMVDTATGQVLADIHGSHPMAPASNLKLVTTAAALDVLGPDFNFETLLIKRPVAAGASGPPSLVVVGDGDPAFLDPKTLAVAKLTPDAVMAAWQAAAQKASPQGYRELVVDDRVFDAQGVPTTWPKDQLGRWYGVGASGLNFHNNVFWVTPHPTKPGAGVNVDVYPLGSFISVRNTAVTAAKGQHDNFLVARDGNTLKVAGIVPYTPEEPFRVPMADPALNFGEWFAERLNNAKVPTGPTRRAEAGAAKIAAGDVVIHKIQTPIQAVLNRTNRDSYNLYAECLLKRIEVKASNRQGSFAGGCAAVRSALAKRLGEKALDGYEQIDGCGLSKGNRVTTRLMAQLVASVDKDPKLSATYRQSLATPGMDGSTLEKRFRGAELNGQVYGKSGYINGVSALSGLVVSKGGRSASFSVIGNADGGKGFDVHAMKALQEGLVEILDKQLK